MAVLLAVLLADPTTSRASADSATARNGRARNQYNRPRMPIGTKIARCVYVLPPPTCGVTVTSSHALPGARFVERSSKVAGSRSATLHRPLLFARRSAARLTSSGRASLTAVRTAV